MNAEPEDVVAVGEDDQLETRVDVTDELPEESDPYKRRVAVVLAVLGVLGAWIGVLHMDSANQESYFARQTTRTAVGSLTANLNKEALEGLSTDLDAEADALEMSTKFDPGTPVGANEPKESKEPDQVLAADGVRAGIDSKQRDRLTREFTLNSEREVLKRKALAETRVAYNIRTSQFETVLTTLAAALFLVGFTLVLNRRTRPPVLIPGLLLAVYVAGWAVWIHAKDVPTTAPESIDAAAEAATHLAFGEFAAAVDGYTRAIEADSDFVPAFNGRALASFQISNPDFASTLAIVDTATPEAKQAVSDAETAVRLDQEQNFNGLMLSGIFQFHDGDYATAAHRIRQATAINGNAPEAYLTLAATELALGDQVAALDALGTGIDILNPATDSSEARQLTADLFTLLEQVDAAEPERSADVAEVRSVLAAEEAQLAFGPFDPKASTDAKLTLESSSYIGNDLSFEIAYAGLPAESRVSVYVFEQPAKGAPFSQRAELARFETLSGTGTLVSEASVQAACTPVAFRYDVYVDGALANSFDAAGAEGGQTAC
ncbi:hypothetical protein [Candidatus Microthrix parvicella]|uniref:hypothetical protein n=1 Tax=Candidatus Neomicrothrix parvicella TaxID=41950 RepID=UPI00037EBEC4|nr:hypothetical protein [Candidatus Microthrix parvicella]